MKYLVVMKHNTGIASISNVVVVEAKDCLEAEDVARREYKWAGKASAYAFTELEDGWSFYI